MKPWTIAWVYFAALAALSVAGYFLTAAFRTFFSGRTAEEQEPGLAGDCPVLWRKLVPGEKIEAGDEVNDIENMTLGASLSDPPAHCGGRENGWWVTTCEGMVVEVTDGCVYRRRGNA